MFCCEYVIDLFMASLQIPSTVGLPVNYTHQHFVSTFENIRLRHLSMHQKKKKVVEQRS